jgi:type IV pilus assembly protein PilA
MLQLLTARLDRRKDASEDGFTLIELMVVVLIIAILIAIAIPTFLGARQTAQDRAAQSDLRNALTAVKTAYVDSQNYASDGPAVWNSVEPSLNFVASNTSSTSDNEVSSNTPSDDTVILTNYSASGKCWYIEDVTGADGNDTAGTFYSSGSASNGSCSASAATPGAVGDPSVTGSTWLAHW